MKNRFASLYRVVATFDAAKKGILERWVHYGEARSVLHRHGIDEVVFVADYAGSVFDYFMDVIRGTKQIGDCPVMAQLLNYLKDRDVSSDELYTICSHFQKAMLDFSYDSGLNSRELFNDISDVFNQNFAGVLKMYSQRLYEKDQEIAKNVKLLDEYKKAIDQSALVSKTDDKGRILYVNENLTRLCGFSEAELMGKTHRIMRHPDMPADFYAALWKTIKAEKVFKGTIKNRKKNGESFYIDTTIVPIVDPVSKQHTNKFMAIGYEVTRLIEARQEAEMADAAKEYFLSNMSHEIRTPLNAILGFVSLLLGEQGSEKHKQYLDIIYNSGENLLSIINDILDFSKLRSGEFMIERKPFNLHEELGNTLELFSPSANQKKITFFSFIDPSIPMDLVADGLRIKQIVSNLLSNAIKFTPYEGCIDILAQIEDGKLRILVQDNGIGIAPEDQGKIFNAFSQGQNYETRVAGGTGLGLSICSKLAEHMDGTIELESTPGKGSCFTLVLPVEYGETRTNQHFDTTVFEPVRLGLLHSERSRPEIVALLKRYWEIFGLDAVPVGEIGQGCCDLLFFVDSDIDAATRSAIISSGIRSVAIMEHLEDCYDDIESVTPLHFPIYCSKLYNTMSRALGLPLSCEKAEAGMTHRRFAGHMLVAEDNAANRELMKIILNRYGLTYDMVTDGVEAVEAYKNGTTYDMILMDEQMPRMNGLDATRLIRAYESEQGLRPLPVVAITANVVKGVKERGMKSGYSAFIGKPIFPRELEGVFQIYLRETDASEAVLPAEHTLDGADVYGLDMQKLQKELMLDADQIVMLLNVFVKKVGKLMPELEDAIRGEEYAKIAKHAHSIKGSSANFRMDEVQKLAKSIEDAASSQDAAFDYRAAYDALKTELSKVRLDS